MGDYEKVVQAVKAAQMAVGMWSDRVRQSGERRHGMGPTDPLWEVDADYSASLDAAATLSEALEVLEGMAGVAGRTEREHAEFEARARARMDAEGLREARRAVVLNELAEAGFEHQEAEFRHETAAERVRRAVLAAHAEGVSVERAAQVSMVSLDAVTRWTREAAQSQTTGVQED